MESAKKYEKVILELSKDEAIVFLERVSRFNQDDRSDSFQDQSEKRILWDIEACLEKEVTETFSSNYSKILARAREEVRD
ncbi:hypothetical protein [Echinicola rosea]|uniref:Uncharacterized protein n=1 Tax=Echinicola rosea TaxID=1807691 RepID=A0ABQ1V169_9BACT|nr:hypothetical protein [Echinicola rosea]GGF31421.1 hypothetical protein GCM10011339_19540 [Echinicola rosea]